MIRVIKNNIWVAEAYLKLSGFSENIWQNLFPLKKKTRQKSAVFFDL